MALRFKTRQTNPQKAGEKEGESCYLVTMILPDPKKVQVAGKQAQIPLG